MAAARTKDITTVKKYSNRRLYDTSDSRYITLDELASKIRGGSRVRVVDAKSEQDLTQATLAQIILESRRAARLLPTPLLVQLIRMEDDALSEFFSTYMSWALDVYTQAKRQAQAISPFNPFATLPFSGANALSQLFNQSSWRGQDKAASGEQPQVDLDEDDDITELRREIEELKALLREKAREEST